jgi:hypothetical protein
MYVLRPDEKTTPVMLYTQQGVVRGEAVTKDSVARLNIWLRTDAAPRYVHLLKPQVLLFGGSPAKTLSYTEIYFPTSQVIAFHTLPPVEEPLDYDPDESNRTMEVADLLVGTFIMKGQLRISSQMEIATSLEMARVSWLSVYEVVISNPYLPQMPALQVPMVLVDPMHIAFGLA